MKNSRLIRVVLIFIVFFLFCSVKSPSFGYDMTKEKINGKVKQGVFGSTKKNPFIFKGDIYFLPAYTRKLPDFGKLKPAGRIYTSKLYIPPRRFDKGFPGISHRFEWFAIDYKSKIYIPQSKVYRFALLSDDGSKLLIDHKVVIDNDGVHPPREKSGSVFLKKGLHSIEVKYFQGPRYYVALELFLINKGKKVPFDIRQYAPVVMTKNRCLINLTLNSGILFDFNSYALKPEAIRTLNTVYKMLKGMKYKKIVVEGYADNVGSYDYNLKLSRKRALSVANYLIAKNVTKNVVDVKGFGSSNPKYPNDTEEHRALNRRVEIKVYLCSNIRQADWKQKQLDGVVEVYKGYVYIVVNPACKCRQSYLVVGDFKQKVKRYAGKEVVVSGRVKKTSPWSGKIEVEKILNIVR